jgi:hypothetical protein
MGLDMYLNRMPRYKGATARDVSKVEHYMDWLKAKASGSEHAQCTFKEWCGYDRAPSTDYLNFYSDYYHVYYSDWDTEKKHPWTTIMEQVGYWRKANQIHNWFVENIQDGVDDCCYHREVTEEDLMELLDVCKRVLDGCELVVGEVCNGYKYEDGIRVPIMEIGKYVKDSSVAEELLPSTSGFFFGNTEYNEWYVEDIEDTIHILQKVLETTDFETQMIYYCSSW